MDSVSIDIQQPFDTKKSEGSFKRSAEKSELARDVPEETRPERRKDSACKHEIKSVPRDDDSLISAILGHLKSWLRLTFENVSSKPGGRIVLSAADSGLLVAERVSFWIQDSSSLRCVPWLVMLPFLISARVVNFFLSVTERITGLPMPTQRRVIKTIRILRNDICVMRKMGLKKVEMDKQDKEMDSATPAEDKEVHVENTTTATTTSDEEEGACAMVEDIGSQITDPVYVYSSTLEESSDCDSELGRKIESMLSTVSTTLDDSYASF